MALVNRKPTQASMWVETGLRQARGRRRAWARPTARSNQDSAKREDGLRSPDSRPQTNCPITPSLDRHLKQNDFRRFLGGPSRLTRPGLLQPPRESWL